MLTKVSTLGKIKPKAVLNTVKAFYKKISSAKEIIIVYKTNRKRSSVSSLPFSKKVKITLNIDPREVISEEDITKIVLTLAYEYSGNLANIIGLIAALIIFVATIISNITNIPLITGYLTALIAGSLISQGIATLRHTKKAYSDEALKLHTELYSSNMTYREMVSTIAYILRHSAQTLINKEHVGTLLLQRKIYRYTTNLEEKTVEYVRI